MSEEQKAINILKNMTTNYSLSGEQLHYANILYYLIINLQQENKELHNKIDNASATIDTNLELIEHLGNKIDKAIEYLINPPKKIWEGHSIDEVVRILKDNE